MKMMVCDDGGGKKWRGVQVTGQPGDVVQ